MNSVSPNQIRTLMLTIPSWTKVLPNIEDSTPFPDCGVDSLALLELVGEFQRVYGVEVPDDDVEKISTIADAARYLSERMQ